MLTTAAVSALHTRRRQLRIQVHRTRIRYRGRMVRFERVRTASALRTVTRVVITLVLVLGITAMHSMFGASMNTRMQSPSTATAVQMDSDPPAVAAIGAAHRPAAVPSNGSAACTREMPHGVMHACLFTASAIVLAASAAPAVGEQHMPSPRRSAATERERLNAFPADRPFALQVLRI